MKLLLVKEYEWLKSESAYSIYSQCMYKPSYKKYLIEMQKLIEDPKVVIFTCCKDGCMVGIIVLRKSVDFAEIVGIAVSKQLHRKGVGSFLIKESIKILNLSKLIAETDVHGVEFYKKLGFSIKTIIKQYPDGESIRYQCQINL